MIRRHLAAAAAAIAAVAATAARADDAVPCRDLQRNRDGSWTALELVQIGAAPQLFMRPGTTIRRGETFHMLIPYMDTAIPADIDPAPFTDLFERTCARR